MAAWSQVSNCARFSSTVRALAAATCVAVSRSGGRGGSSGRSAAYALIRLVSLSILPRRPSTVRSRRSRSIVVLRVLTLPLRVLALFDGLSGVDLIGDSCLRAQATELLVSVAPLGGKALGAGSGPYPDLDGVGYDKQHILVHNGVVHLTATEHDRLAVDINREVSRGGRVDRGDRGLGTHHRQVCVLNLPQQVVIDLDRLEHRVGVLQVLLGFHDPFVALGELFYLDAVAVMVAVLVSAALLGLSGAQVGSGRLQRGGRVLDVFDGGS